MASQALSYAELLVGGVLATAGFTGKSPLELVGGKRSPLSKSSPLSKPAQSKGGK